MYSVCMRDPGGVLPSWMCVLMLPSGRQGMALGRFGDAWQLGQENAFLRGAVSHTRLRSNEDPRYVWIYSSARWLAWNQPTTPIGYRRHAASLRRQTKQQDRASSGSLVVCSVQACKKQLPACRIMRRGPAAACFVWWPFVSRMGGTGPSVGPWAPRAATYDKGSSITCSHRQA